MANNYYGQIDNRDGKTYIVTPYSTAEAFSTSTAYVEGEYCFYDGILYVFTADKSAGAWDSTKVETAIIGDDIAVLKGDMTHKAEIDGYYDGMTVGNAEQIVGTVFEEDDTAYNYRTTGGSAEVGDRAYVDAIVGGSLVWNQLLQNGDFESTSGWGTDYSTVSVANNVLTMKPSTTGRTTFAIRGTNLVSSGQVVGHKYLGVIYAKPNTSMSSYLTLYNYNTPITACVANAWTEVGCVFNLNAVTSNYTVRAYAYRGTGSETFGLDDEIQFKDFMVFDLTAMFGSTIADYIYGLETAHAGDGVAWFKRYFPKDFYSYSAPAFQHVNATAVKTVGFNQFDKSTVVGGYIDDSDGGVKSSAPYYSSDYIKVIPSQTYYVKTEQTGGLWGAWYDASKNYISGINYYNNTTIVAPSNAHYARFTVETSSTGNRDTFGVHIHWDNSRDGDYEPYNLHTYPLADITLRGIPLIDESGNLKFNGDRYLPNGTVERTKGILVVDGTNVKVTAWNVANAYEGFTCYITAPNLNPFKREYSISDRFLATSNGVSNAPIMSCGSSSGADTTYSFVLPSTVTSQAEANAWFASNPTTIIYELATPTTEEADPYQYPMVVDNWGTEEFVDGLVESGDRDVAIPVGHETKYPPNLKDKLESAANNPDSDGEFILKHDGSSNTYIPLSSNATIQNILARLEALEGGGENE